MKQSRFYILFFFVVFVVCIGLFCSCLSNDDDAQWSKFNGVYVTVSGDNIRGYKLYTDFGAILVPTEESLNRIPWLKEVQRAIVSFNLLDENENTTQLEDGKTYDVILNSTNGMNQQIPTFTVHVDTLSEEYQISGQDSIHLKNKSIYSLDKTAEAFYIKNGYMNIVPTFEYDLYKPVFFLLYYDGEKDIDISNNKLNLNLYFNNSIQSSNNSISSFISLEMPGEIYYKFQDKGMNDDDLIDVYLNSETVSGQEQIHCKMALKDFMLP